MKRPANAVYPRLPDYKAAFSYYSAIKPIRGHRDNPARPLVPGLRTLTAWRIAPTPDGIACIHLNTIILTYPRSGGVRITTPPRGSVSLTVIRAIAPVETVKWDYYNDCLVVHAGGTRYTCKAGESILLPAQGA